MNKNRLRLIILIFYSFVANIVSQNIIVNGTYTAQQLIQNVLINSSCANVSNFTVSGGNFQTGEQSFGYFDSNSTSFPFTNGIVLSTSKAISTQGPNTYILSETAPGWIGDSDLEQAVKPNARAIDTAKISDLRFCTLSPFRGVSNTRKGY